MSNPKIQAHKLLSSTLARKVGFTLIELLVVLFIIGIVSGVILLSIGSNEHYRMRAFAQDLQGVLLLAEQEAILLPAILKLSIEPDHYQFFYYLTPQGDTKKSPWQVFDDPILNKKMIPANVTINLQLQDNKENEENKKEQAIIISSSGNLTPFKLVIGKANSNPAYILQGDENGRISLQEVNH